MTDARIRFRCAGCQKRLVVDRVHAGRKVRCPGCGRPLTVPVADAASTPVATPSEAPPALSVWTPPVQIATAILLLLGLVAIIFGNLATRIVVVLIGLSMLNGYWLGASRVVGAIVGMLLAIATAVPVGRACEGLVGGVFGTSGLVNRMFSIAICALVLMALVATLMSIPIGRWLKRRPRLRRYDRLVGAGLGIAEGTLMALFVIWGALAVEPIVAANVARGADPVAGAAPTRAAQIALSFATAAQESVVGQVTAPVNPLRHMRALNLLERAEAVLSDPQRCEAFALHPLMQQVRERPSVKRAGELLADAALVNLDDGLSGDEVRTLLTSRRLLEILDETQVLSELSPIADDIAQALAAAEETPDQ